jgi:hypothetical protein
LGAAGFLAMKILLYGINFATALTGIGKITFVRKKD